jgi:hypothetical protein
MITSQNDLLRSYNYETGEVIDDLKMSKTIKWMATFEYSNTLVFSTRGNIIFNQITENGNFVDFVDGYVFYGDVHSFTRFTYHPQKGVISISPYHYTYFSASYVQGFESPACAQPALESFSAAKCESCAEGATKTNGVCVPSSNLYSIGKTLDLSEELTGGVKTNFADLLTFEQLEVIRLENEALAEEERQRMEGRRSKKDQFVIIGLVLFIFGFLLLVYVFMKACSLKNRITEDIDMNEVLVSNDVVDIRANEEDIREQELILFVLQELKEEWIKKHGMDPEYLSALAAYSSNVDQRREAENRIHPV